MGVLPAFTLDRTWNRAYRAGNPSMEGNPMGQNNIHRIQGKHFSRDSPVLVGSRLPKRRSEGNDS